MSFLNALRQAPTTPQAKLNTFLAVFRPDGKNIAAFLEGRDDPAFFRFHLESTTRTRRLGLDFYVLGNKSEVLEARKFIGSRYPNNPRVLFFVDKDHDDLLGAPVGAVTDGTLFVTQGYAIENYLVSEETVRVVLMDLWGLDSSNPAVPVACSQFLAAINQFYVSVQPWMAWLLAARRRGLRPSADNLSLRKVCSITGLMTVSFNWPTDSAQRDNLFLITCGLTTGPTAVEVETVERELAQIPPKKWVRGKAELAFLVLFLECLTSEAKLSAHCPRQRTTIGAANAVEVLAARLPCPPDLDIFLEGHLNEI